MKNIFIIAGEPSGDLQASKLLKQFKLLEPNVTFTGIGGDKMLANGLNMIKHMREMAFMGFVEVIKHLPEILKNIRFVKSELLKLKPDILILIDYPGFNLKIAKYAHQHDIPVVYYITPQLWAWHESRVKLMKKYVNLIINVFPFEVDFYNRYGIKSYYFGHPLTEDLKTVCKTKEIFIKMINHDISKKKVIGLLPGSRKSEVIKMMPTLLLYVKKHPEYHFCLGKVTHLEISEYGDIESLSNISVHESMSYDIMAYSDCVISTSGTATLETACFETPLIVVYKTSAITYMIAKKLVKLEYISLVNIIAEKKIVEELIQDDFNLKSLDKQTTTIFENYSAIKENLKEIANSLKHKDVSKKVAQFIISEFRNEN
jgi:lipid-A-disaccharide synthase